VTIRGRPTIDYATPQSRPSRPRFFLWLFASLLFLAATAGSLLAYVWWLRLS